MDVDLFDFDLPEERIALRPARPRDAAKLLHVPADGRFADHIVRDLPDLLRAGDVLVLNDTRVIPARLRARRRAREAGGGSADVAVEIMLHKREAPDAWRAFLKPGKRVKAGDTLHCDGELTATCLEKGEGDALLRFDSSGPALDAAVAAAGETPLPPYIEGRRKTDAADAADYQTVFAAKDGSVAAPTASLHFTDALLARIEARGVERVEVTLHVGAGTFLPVSAKDTKDHVMHGEWGEVSPAAADAMARAKAEGRRIVSAGTTALRLIETAARGERIAPFVGDTDIFITPGFQFRAADLLLTNFHLPRSTLFMLVAAFSGLERMKAAYAHAVGNDYRFYSYGDASLLERAG